VELEFTRFFDVNDMVFRSVYLPTSAHIVYLDLDLDVPGSDLSSGSSETTPSPKCAAQVLVRNCAFRSQHQLDEPEVMKVPYVGES
jgi:hypothetical protein